MGKPEIWINNPVMALFSVFYTAFISKIYKCTYCDLWMRSIKFYTSEFLETKKKNTWL